jgi:hypothetical protein
VASRKSYRLIPELVPRDLWGRSAFRRRPPDFRGGIGVIPFSDLRDDSFRDSRMMRLQQSQKLARQFSPLGMLASQIALTLALLPADAES